jgi:hypothetical protein
MSVIYANRISTEKTGSEDDKVRTLEEQYRITTDVITDDQAVILNSGFSGNSANGSIALPQVGDAHPTDPLVTVKSRSLEPTENRFEWRMNVSYSNAVDALSSPGGGGGGGGPVVLQVTIGKWDETFILEFDYSNTPKRIKNSAGDPIKYESSRPQIMMTFSSQTQDPDFVKYQGMQGKVNDGPVKWLGFDFKKDQILFDEYRAASIGNNTWREDFIFKVRQVPDISGNGRAIITRHKGWQPILLDAGFNELKDKDGQKELGPIFATQKASDKSPPRPVTQEWPLDGNGVHLPAEIIEGSKIFIEFQAFVQDNFNKFDFDFQSILTEDEQVQVGIL